MKRYIFTMSCGIVGSKKEEIAEYDYDVSGEEVENDYKSWVAEQIDGSYRRID